MQILNGKSIYDNDSLFGMGAQSALDREPTPPAAAAKEFKEGYLFGQRLYLRLYVGVDGNTVSTMKN